jgi:hypothetical protein
MAAFGCGTWLAERTAFATEPAGPLFNPEGPGAYRWRVGIGTLIDLFPKRIVLTSQYDTPQVAITGRLGLPFDFSVDVRGHSLLVTSEGSLGVAWSRQFGPVRVGIMDHQGAAYGTFEEDNGTASTWTLVNEPGLAVGMAFERVRVSVTGEAIITFDQHTKAQGPQLTRPGSRLGGSEITFVAEQIFSWGLLYVGAGWMRTTADYLSWFATNDPRSRVNYLRLVAGYAF